MSILTNTVISVLHFYLQEHGLNASCLSLNAENCSGQNKNNTMIQVCRCNAIKIIAHFCLFLVPYVEGLTRQNKLITISFVPAGHTKFSPDWCFGQKFHKTEVGCLNEIAKVVEESASVNIAQMTLLRSPSVIPPPDTHLTNNLFCFNIFCTANYINSLFVN